MTVLNNIKNFVDGYTDKTVQVQPNSIDLTISEVKVAVSRGEVGFYHKKLPTYEEIPINDFDSWELNPQSYLITFAETVRVPLNCVGFLTQRSTLARCLGIVHGGLWDSGYEGRSNAVLTVHNKQGLLLYRNARIAQMYFITTEQAAQYMGSYMNENTNPNNH